ncbi:hypothetical protein HDU76_001011 [Blyttiomyces sp. JEL0837]|nr:hypothetical protein HDU76_001011 [Blyttiomyces sp. JEL0837]
MIVSLILSVLAAVTAAPVNTTTEVPPAPICQYTPVQGGWTLDPYLTADLPKIMPIANAQTADPALPSSLYGLWWLNNTQPTGLCSLAGVKSNKQGHFLFPAFNELRYSYDNDNEGINGWNGWKYSFREDFYFDMSFTNPEKTAVIFNPVFYGLPELIKFQNFSMFYVEDGHWERKSTLLNFTTFKQQDVAEGDYPVWRVVDGDGNVNVTLFEQFLEFNKARSGSAYSLLGKKHSALEFAKICLKV